ncbi:MAG: aromatic amino acid lyase, partial [Gemmatimonadaceae bacterium]|nr:aromatic amino acid lyase [Gemmatimonadaceae bacterium]
MNDSALVVEIDGSSLTVDTVCAVALDGARVALSPGSRARMQRTHGVVAGIVDRGETVYGVTTGFGKLSEIAIPLDRLAELQVNLVRSHAA